MKKYILSAAVMILASFSLVAQQIKFETKTIEYGRIEQGSNELCELEFTNVGDAPLIITRAGTNSGGSMVNNYPREPIMPQQKGYIVIRYDTRRLGRFVKSLWVESNSVQDSLRRFQIVGEVVPKNIPNTEKQ
jgi:hypothetical protein